MTYTFCNRVADVNGTDESSGSTHFIRSLCFNLWFIESSQFNPNTGAHWRSGQSNHCTGVEETHGRTENPQQPRWQKKHTQTPITPAFFKPGDKWRDYKGCNGEWSDRAVCEALSPPVSSPQVGSSSRTIPQNPQRSGTKTVLQQLH